MRRHQPSEDVATEPYAARGDDASGTFCLREKLFKRNFVLQKLVAVHNEFIALRSLLKMIFILFISKITT